MERRREEIEKFDGQSKSWQFVINIFEQTITIDLMKEREKDTNDNTKGTTNDNTTNDNTKGTTKDVNKGTMDDDTKYKYQLKALFQNVAYILNQKNYCSKSHDNYGGYHFFDRSFRSFDDVFKDYNILIERIKTREKVIQYQKDQILSREQYDGDIILSECNICSEDFGDQYCHKCGYCVCQYCVYNIRKYKCDYKCPQCRLRYTYIEYEYELDEYDCD